MVLFSKSVLQQLNAVAANMYSGSSRPSSVTPTWAASLCTYLFFLKPQWCGKVRGLCKPHSPIEVELFCISIYLVAIGFGAPEPTLATVLTRISFRRGTRVRA
ncbi:hypothetical protein CDL15_Pgr016349 [Punica granatum]|uniref:Uncharacterized protein n=1 Tax=Punica granatum TaxID=22663 RepID=A0A218W6L2_PUNGR|nr:hypothetical protein CDL15_Pgr016349 [Punica granatum]